MPPSSSSESEEEESDTEQEQNSEHYEQQYAMASPAPAPMPIMVEPPPVVTNNDDNKTLLQQPEDPNPASEEDPTTTTTSSRDDKHSDNLQAAAALIQTLDTEYAHANAENATTALDAEEARSAARTAAEIVRRYTTRSHPRQGSTLQFATATSTSISTSRSPMASTSSASATYFVHPTSTENSSNNNNHHTSTTNTNARTPPQRYYPNKTPSSTADRMAQSHAQDVVTLSLELERTKQALEAAHMAHDDTKNALAEERSKSSLLQRKLQTLEGTLETQRETLGRSGDALEENLERATLRMEAAEEDAQLALDFAKESEENREQMEHMLEQALVELQSLRETVHHYQYYEIQGQLHLPPIVEGGETIHHHHKSSMKPVEGEEGTDEDQTASMEGDGSSHKRSVRFSDPISFSNSPSTNNQTDTTDAEGETAAHAPAVTVQPQDEVATTPSRPSRPLVSAGRKLLQRSHEKASKDSKTYKFEFTPGKTAERRQQLREQLKQLDAGVVIRTPSSSEKQSPFARQLQELSAGKTNSLLEACKTATELLQASGKRLELEGHWWRETEPSGSRPGDAEEVPLESLARQYCQSVEVSLLRSSACYSHFEVWKRQ